MKESSTPPWGGRGRGVLDEGDTGDGGRKEAFCFFWKDPVSRRAALRGDRASERARGDVNR
jgi:hypothetical protein